MPDPVERPMKSIARPVLLAVLGFTALAAGAADPVEGGDYQRIDPPVATSDTNRIVVTQFFSYQCPHCDKFEKPFNAWAAKQPADVKVERAAVAIGHAAWQPAAVAYYALSSMKAVPAIDEAFFAAIHREGKPLASESAIADWVATQGIDRAKFLEAYRSFGVQVKAKRADSLSRDVRLPSIPSLVVNGKYLVPIADDGDFGDQLAVVDALVARERAAQAKASGP